MESFEVNVKPIPNAMTHFLFLFLFTIAACQTTPRDKPTTVALTKGFDLQLPNQLFPARHSSQLLTFIRDGQERSFHVILRQSETLGLKLLAFDMLGTPLFELSYKPNCKGSSDSCGDSALSVSPVPPPGGFHKKILRDLFFIFGDRDRLRKRISSQMSLYTSPQARNLSLQGRKILDIQYSDPNPWKGSIRYENFEEKYSLKIKNLPLEPQ